MKPDWWPGKIHESFTEWAISQGIEVNGVAPARFPGRGLGMIATRNITEGEAMVIVPLSAMLTIDSIPQSFIDKFTNDISVHGLIAAFLTHGDPEDLEKYHLWKQVWPSRKDFQDSMPILWPQSLRVSNSEFDSTSSQTIYLPPSISGRWNCIRKRKPEYEYDTHHQNLLAQQEKRLRTAWEKVVAVFPDTDWDTYLYYWLVVNTRSFYYLMPSEEPPEDRNDAMAMLPFADYFNHSDGVACDVFFDGIRYTFRATQSYAEGEEIYMSYGPHPNDFLFAEYGFFLDENDSEAIYLDDIIFRDLSLSHQEELNLQGYYGDYRVSHEGVCFRTEVAACMKYMTRRDWRDYVMGQSTKGVDAKKTAAIIEKWIRIYLKEANTTIVALEAIQSQQSDEVCPDKVAMLLRRWRQIREFGNNALQRLSC